MQNQAAVEALYSATFVEDYLDCVENLPSDLQRHLTRLKEFDLIQYTEFLKDLSTLVSAFEKETTASGQRAILTKIQQGLITAQDTGDDKLIAVQAISDIIESKTRQMEHDAKNLDFDIDNEQEDVEEPVSTPVSHTNKTTPSQKSVKKHLDEKSEKSVGKKRKKEDKSANHDSDSVSASSKSDKLVSKKNLAGKRGVKANVAGQAKRKQMKRGAAIVAAAANAVDRDDSDQDNEFGNIEIDPDEPTYCLCDQVSFGEMIGCDNDLCPIEWFHFQCVQLTNKPKGKWFCPKCRGDKPTIMKPKALFLKELEKYNKEREEKMSTQS